MISLEHPDISVITSDRITHTENVIEELRSSSLQWRVLRLKNVASCNDDVLPETTDPTFKFDYVEIADVHKRQGIINTTRMTFAQAPSRARRLVKVGDTIISTVRTYLEAVAPITEQYAHCVVSTGFAVIRPHKGTHPKFLQYILQSTNFIAQVVARSTGVSYPAITASELMRISISLPLFPQQCIIADYLDQEMAQIDELIEAKEELLKLLTKKKRALITNLIPFAPQETHGKASTVWTERKLKYIVDVIGGGTPSTENIEYWGGDIPWVSPKDMHTSEIRDTEDHVTPEAIEESSTQLIEPGAVLVVCRSGILKHTIPCAINEVAVTLNQDMRALIPHKGVSNRYLQNFIVGHQDTLLALWRKAGATVESIEYEYMMNTKVPLPEYAKQQEISDRLERELECIEVVAATAKDTMTLLRQRRATLIANAITGQLGIGE